LICARPILSNSIQVATYKAGTACSRARLLIKHRIFPIHILTSAAIRFVALDSRGGFGRSIPRLVLDTLVNWVTTFCSRTDSRWARSILRCSVLNKLTDRFVAPAVLFLRVPKQRCEDSRSNA
jgi:hypothetical protein